MNEKQTQRVLLLSMALLLVVVVGVSFSVTGGPSYNRKRRFDEERLRNLQNIHYQIESYRRVLKSLPAAIEALEERRGGYYGYRIEDKDPESGLPYRFERNAGGGYRLCATFSLPASREEVREMTWSGSGKQWAHPAGEHCFEFE